MAILAITFSSEAQCNATFTYTYVDCDSIWFVPNSTGPQYTYQWNFGDGGVSTSSHPVHVYAADGSYPVYLILSDTVAGCTDILTMMVNITCGTPCSISTAWAHTVNSGNCNTQFTSTVLSSNPPFTYYWDFGDGTTSNVAHPSHQYGNNAWYFPCLTVTDANGCTATYCDTVAVTCNPTSCDAQFTQVYASCDSIWFVPVSQGAQYFYNWSFGDGTYSNAMYPSHQYSADGTYGVVLQLFDTISGCNAIYTGLVTVDCGANCNINGAFAWNVDSINCNVQFVSTAWGGTAPYSFYWDFGDGNTSTNAHPTHQFPINTNPGWWWTCLTITDANGCDTVICDTIMPNCAPASCDALFTVANIGCDSVWFYPASYGMQYDYFWSFGDGTYSTLPSPTHVYGSNGIYVISLTVIDSLSMCSDSYYYTIMIDCGTCNVDGGFAYSVDSNTCDVQFISTAWGGSAPYNYYWVFGDGSTSNQANPSHGYPTNGVWTPCLTITDVNGCDTSFCQPIYVNCNPQSCNGDFSYTPITCDSIWFTPDIYSQTASYTWYFDDGYMSNSPSPAHQYGANGTYYVVLEMWDSLTGCYDSSLVIVNINCNTNCNVDGAFTWYSDSVSCNIQFVSTAFGGTAPYTYYWDFGDGSYSTQQHPTHSYPNNTTFTPCLTITDANGCDTTICGVVYSQCTGSSCNAQFTYSYVACDSVWFIPTALGNQYYYYWTFGDGSSSTLPTPAHQYASNGTYPVVLYIIDSLAGCSSAYTMLINVNCGFTPCGVNGAFASVVDSVNCMTYFTSTAFGGTAPYTYFWNFGDGTTSTLAHPMHQYSYGVYTPCVTITDANGCDTTICNVVYAYCYPPACNAMFSYAQITCDSIWFVPNTVGTGITHYWNFGDGTTSTATYPSHQYAANGTYLAVLTIIDSNIMCSDSYTVPVMVNCGNCSIGAVITYVPDTTNCGVYFASSVYGGSQPYTYFWDFGDGTYSSAVYPNHVYSSYGTYQACLTATDANGCDTTICMYVLPNCTVGMEEKSLTYIHVYPNPSSDIFNIELPSNASMEVYDVSGKLLLSSGQIYGQQIYQLDLDGFTPGAYILRIKIDDEIIAKRLIKN